MTRLPLLLALAITATAHASTMTVLGSMPGKIFYDGKDVGTIPLRLTAVPPGRHVVRVVTSSGVDRTFDLTYPKTSTTTDRVIDMDVELSRREPATSPVPQNQPPTYRPYDNTITRYEYVQPSSSDYYRNYDSRDYRSNYGVYPYGYNQPYYGGNYYGYGGYPGYYDNYGGVFNNYSTFNRGFRRDSGSSFSSSPGFSSSPTFSPPVTPTFQGPAGTPTFTPPPISSAVTPVSPGAISPGSLRVNTQAMPAGTMKRPDEP
jgi:hypothetical protein